MRLAAFQAVCKNEFDLQLICTFTSLHTAEMPSLVMMIRASRTLQHALDQPPFSHEIRQGTSRKALD